MRPKKTARVSVSRIFFGIVICAITFLGTSSAMALSVSAEFNLPLSSFANAVTMPLTGSIEVDLTPGDVIVLDVIVSNEPTDVMTALFASIIYDSRNVSFLGGAYSNILTEATCTGFLCAPATMRPLSTSPTEKANSPVSMMSGTTGWVQAVAHASIGGTNGQGPDSAVLLAFQYNGPAGLQLFGFTAALTTGDASAGNVGPVNFSGVYFAPEPGTGLLLGLGLLGLGSVRRTDSPTTVHQPDLLSRP